MEFDTIFVTGPQGCGKGTQGVRLAQKLGFFYWDTGTILRELSKTDTPLGRKLQDIHRGILLGDDLIIEVIKEKYPGIPKGRGVIFDGVPRRVGQAEFLIKLLQEEGKKKPITLFVDIPREVSFARLLARAQHERRDDDYLQGIETRLRYYDEATIPMYEYMKTATTFIPINGNVPVEEVAKEIDAALGL